MCTSSNQCNYSYQNHHFLIPALGSMALAVFAQDGSYSTRLPRGETLTLNLSQSCVMPGLHWPPLHPPSTVDLLLCSLFICYLHHLLPPRWLSCPALRLLGCFLCVHTPHSSLRAVFPLSRQLWHVVLRGLISPRLHPSRSGQA